MANNNGEEHLAWRRIEDDSDTYVNTMTGDMIYPGSDVPPPETDIEDDGLSGEREPRNPKASPDAGAIALKLAEADQGQI